MSAARPEMLSTLEASTEPVVLPSTVLSTLAVMVVSVRVTASLPRMLMPVTQPSFNRYKVNLIVDNSRTEGAPVIIESNPTYTDLIGRIDRQVRFGALTTDFTMINGAPLSRIDPLSSIS